MQQVAALRRALSGVREGGLLCLGGLLFFVGGCFSEGDPSGAPPVRQQAAAPDTAGTTATVPSATPPTVTNRGRSVEERIADASRAAHIRTALAENRQLRPFDFAPRVLGDRVTLQGNVATRAQGEMAAEVAAGVDGIDEVFNRLTVDGQQIAWNAPEEPDEQQPRTAATQQPAASGPGDGSASGSTYHTVQAGESLWTIADDYGTSVSRLKALNDLRSDGVQAGKRLLVKQGRPASGASLASETRPANGTSTGEKEAVEYYVVKRGETLWTIARKNDMTVAHLKELNGLSGSRLVPGDRLRVE